MLENSKIKKPETKTNKEKQIKKKELLLPPSIKEQHHNHKTGYQIARYKNAWEFYFHYERQRKEKKEKKIDEEVLFGTSFTRDRLYEQRKN